MSKHVREKLIGLKVGRIHIPQGHTLGQIEIRGEILKQENNNINNDDIPDEGSDSKHSGCFLDLAAFT
jgi:hypothetical protein